MQDIVFLLGNAELGGTEKQITRLGVELSKTGLRVQFIFLKSGGPLLQYLRENRISYEVLGLDIRWAPMTIFKIAQLFKLLKSSNPRFVHALLPENIIIGILSSKIATPRAKRIAGIRGFNPSANYFSRKLLLFALENSTSIFTNSIFLISELKFNSRIKAKTKIFTNGVDLYSERRIQKRNPHLCALVVANLYPYKNHEEIIEAYPHQISSESHIFRIRASRDVLKEISYR